MSRALEKRFEGNGNCWLADGKMRGWKIECAKCGGIKTFTHHFGKGLSPKGLIIRFQREGWQLSNNPKNDLCKKCQRREVLPDVKVAQSKSIISDTMSPMVPVNGARIHFNDLKLAAKQLTVEQARELMGLLRLQLPKRPEPRPKLPKPTPQQDSDYENWLRTLK